MAINRLIACLWFFVFTASTAHAARPYSDPDVWDGKFRYGAYSTLISSYILGTEFRNLITLLNSPVRNRDAIDTQIEAYKQRYESLTDTEVQAIVKKAKQDLTSSIYEEERSIITSFSQNNAFFTGMDDHPELKPVDNLINNASFTSKSFQLNTHRALYNNAYGIPQNSLAAMVNAYVAGIRNIEFDVLETKDNVNVIIHDLVTNRLDGTFRNPSVFIDRATFSHVQATPVNIINPISSTPDTVETTGVNNLIKTEDALSFLYHQFSDATFYIDARNNSPVSIAKILFDNPQYRDMVVVKIYPFTLKGGLYSFVSAYAQRYTNRDEVAARIAIQSAAINALFATGSVASQANAVSYGDVDYQTNVDAAGFNKVKKILPYSRTSTVSKNSFDGHTIFNDTNLIEIEYKTYKFLEWLFEFGAELEPLVIQFSIIPSMAWIATGPVTTEKRDLFNEMVSDVKISSAVSDNILKIFDNMQALNMYVSRYDQVSSSVSSYPAWERFGETIMGFSDRYPDFSFAGRTSSGEIDQNKILDFLYNMTGPVYKKQDFAALLMRSSDAAFRKMRERQDYLYMTTDLPTDMRLGFMGVLGTLGLPADVRYHAAGILKEKYNPPNFSTYVPPVWSSRLYGDSYTLQETKAKNIRASVSMFKYVSSWRKAVFKTVLSADLIDGTFGAFGKGSHVLRYTFIYGAVKSWYMKVTGRLNASTNKYTFRKTTGSVYPGHSFCLKVIELNANQHPDFGKIFYYGEVCDGRSDSKPVYGTLTRRTDVFVQYTSKANDLVNSITAQQYTLLALEAYIDDPTMLVTDGEILSYLGLSDYYTMNQIYAKIGKRAVKAYFSQIQLDISEKKTTYDSVARAFRDFFGVDYAYQPSPPFPS